MNIARDLGLAHLPPVGDEGAGRVWRAAEACLRRYVKQLDHPNPELLVTLSLHNAVELARDNPALDPARTALEELHRLLAEGDGVESESPPEGSVAWRVRRWSDDAAVLRSAPPLRLRHMVPEGFSTGRAQRRGEQVESPLAGAHSPLGLEAPGKL